MEIDNLYYSSKHYLGSKRYIEIRKKWYFYDIFVCVKWVDWQTILGSNIVLNRLEKICSTNFFFGFLNNKITENCKENWIEGRGDRVSVHFAVTFLDCWRTSFCVTTIIKIVNNNTNDKQTSGASLVLDEDSPYTNSCLFSLDRLPLLRKN